MTPAPSQKRLSTFQAFHDVPGEAIARLEALADERRYTAGTRIVTRGDVGDRLFLLRKGTAYATVPDADGAMFRDPMGPGDVFGEMSLLTGEVRSADITAQTDCVCLEVPFAPLRTLFESHPDVAGFLTSIVGTRLGRRDGIRTVGPYQVERGLGGGGFATVFAARHRETGEAVAIKMLRHELVRRGGYAARFEDEAHAIQRLDHPNVVRVRDVIDAYATRFIVMDLVRGRDLSFRLGRAGALPPEEVRTIVRDVASALHAAHEAGVIHRDIKPANILIADDGSVKLVDFGVAIGRDEAASAAPDAPFLGTPHYAAPEHVMKLPMDDRADQFMLGVTAAELLRGTPPDRASTPVEAIIERLEDGHCAPPPASAPPDLAEFIRRCTQQDPGARFSSCAEAVAFLESQAQPFATPVAISLDTSTLSTDAVGGTVELTSAADRASTPTG